MYIKKKTRKSTKPNLAAVKSDLLARGIHRTCNSFSTSYLDAKLPVT